MLKRNLLLKLSSLMLAGSMLVGAPAIIPAAQAKTHESDSATIVAAPTVSGSSIISQAVATKGWTPVRPASSMGSIVFLNSFGSGAVLTIDLQQGNLEAVRDNEKNTHAFIINSEGLYTVPDATNMGMGLMQLALVPGSYNYTATVPSVGTVNGNFDVSAGQILGLTFYGGDAKTIVHNHHSHGDNTTPTSTSVVFTKLLAAPQDLTVQIP